MLYERALLLLFLLHCCWMRVNVSKYRVHQLITIAFHIERSILMLFCVPNLMSVFLRKIFLSGNFVSNNFWDLILYFCAYNKDLLFFGLHSWKHSLLTLLKVLEVKLSHKLCSLSIWGQFSIKWKIIDNLILIQSSWLFFLLTE